MFSGDMLYMHDSSTTNASSSIHIQYTYDELHSTRAKRKCYIYIYTYVGSDVRHQYNVLSDDPANTFFFYTFTTIACNRLC